MILQVKRPNQQCHSTEVNEVKADPTRLRSLKNEEKAVIKKNYYIYIAPLRPKTQRQSEDRELN